MKEQNGIRGEARRWWRPSGWPRRFRRVESSPTERSQSWSGSKRKPVKETSRPAGKLFDCCLDRSQQSVVFTPSSILWESLSNSLPNLSTTFRPFFSSSSSFILSTSSCITLKRDDRRYELFFSFFWMEFHESREKFETNWKVCKGT